MDRITLDMTPLEAILVEPLLSRAAADAFATWRRLLTTNAPEDEQEIAKQSAAILSRVHAGLSRSLYPTCDWPEECEATVVGKVGDGNYCKRHLAQLEARVVDPYGGRNFDGRAFPSGMPNQ
jgi:hypothetical protein